MENTVKILQNIGISPDRLEPKNLERMITFADRCKGDTSNITIEETRELRDILGITTMKDNNSVINKVKKNTQKRNELCNCGSGKKFKKCCIKL